MHAELKDQGQELLLESKVTSLQFVPILGLLQVGNFEKNEIGKPESTPNSAGRIAVFGDSNCIDDSHSHKRNNTIFIFKH